VFAAITRLQLVFRCQFIFSKYLIFCRKVLIQIFITEQYRNKK
jgi:hypothetical protein